MPNYQKGKIYKIIQLDNDENFYVGSTVKTLSGRMSGHRARSKVEDCENLKFYKHVRENGLWDNYKIILIENYRCNSKDELNAREEYWRKLLEPTLNSNSAYQTPEELKDYHRRYRKTDKSKEYQQQYDKMRNATKFDCECGGHTSLNDKAKHSKTMKHQKWIHNWLIDCENYATEHGYL